MPYIPAPIPPICGCLRRGVFLSQIHRKPTEATYRDKPVIIRLSDPSFQRKAALAGYTEDVTDYEAMIALRRGEPRPQPNSTESIVIGPDTYRISTVQDDIGDDCYQLTLTKRRV